MLATQKQSRLALDERRAGWLLVGVILAWLVISLPSLQSYPTAHGDEALFGSVAYNVMQNHSFGIPIYGNINGVREDFIQNGRFYSAALAAWYRLFGVSLWAARLFSVLGAVVTTLFVWLTAKKLMGLPWAVLASALCMFAWKTFYASHRVRPDMWLAFTVSLILWLYVSHPQRHGWLGFAAGVLLNVHPPAVFGLVAISLVRLGDWAAKESRAADLSRFGLGVLGGVAVWAALLFLPDPAHTIAQFQGGIAGIAQGSTVDFADYSVASRLINAWLNLEEGFLGATRLGWLEVLTGVAAAALLVILPSRRQDRSLIVFLVGMIGAMLVSPYLRPYYQVMLIPALALVIGQAARRLAEATRPVAGLALAVPLLAVYMAGDAWLAWQSRNISYPQYAQAIRALVPPGLPVFGDGALWFEYYDQPFTTDMYLTYAEVQSISRADWMRTILESQQIQVIIWSDQLAPWSDVTDESVASFMDVTLHQNCRQLGTVIEPFYGIDRGSLPPRRFEVWQCAPLNFP